MMEQMHASSARAGKDTGREGGNAEVLVYGSGKETIVEGEPHPLSEVTSYVVRRPDEGCAYL